jgi:hypothetical protein
MTRWLPVAAALALTLAAGVAYGIRNDRWTTSPELATMVRRLPTVPMRLGDWIGQDDSNPKMARRLKRRGTVHELVQRVYRDARTGDVVTILLATGRPGPISTHTPETCLGDGGDWDRDGRPRDVAVPGSPPAAFSRCDFRRADGPSPAGMTIYWSWRGPDRWVTAADPRVAFGGARALTKIYVTEDATAARDRPAGEAAADSPAARFLRECLPLIDQALFGPEADAAPAQTAPAAPAA